MEKIIFLDIDGVIATPDSLEQGSGVWTFTDECMENLGYILKNTGAKLVISSSWRKHDVKSTREYFMTKHFRYCGDIFGVTIRGYHYISSGIHLAIPRGVEIKQWLDTNIHSENGKNFNKKTLLKDYNYLILDDDNDMLLEQANNFIRTNPITGLTYKQAQDAVVFLNSHTH